MNLAHRFNGGNNLPYTKKFQSRKGWLKNVRRFLIVLKLVLFKCPWRDIIYDEAR